MINNIIETLKINLIKKLKAHHSVYDLPCTGEYLEELVSKSIAENGHNNDWQPDRKHTISVDMKLENGVSFSVKSGSFDPSKNSLKFSGSRLGKHKTLENMVNSIKETTADYYICVARVKKEWESFPDIKKYYLFIFPAKILDYKGDWVTEISDKGNTNYRLYLDKMDALISPSMSHQLWTNVSLDLIGPPHNIDII